MVQDFSTPFLIRNKTICLMGAYYTLYLRAAYIFFTCICVYKFRYDSQISRCTSCLRLTLCTFTHSRVVLSLCVWKLLQHLVSSRWMLAREEKAREREKEKDRGN